LVLTISLGRVSSKRPCVYPNIGFQLQLCFFEKFRFRNFPNLHLPSEIAISIQNTLKNIEECLNHIFDDETARLNPSRWMDFGFFFQNCREYLGHLDIGLPLQLLTQTDDLSRRLRNLELVFDGPGILTAARLGRVMNLWQSLQARMAAAPGALPRIDLSTYVSLLHDDHLLPSTNNFDEQKNSKKRPITDLDDIDNKERK